MSESCNALLVKKNETETNVNVEKISIDDIKEEELEITTKHSSVNYKDGLATTPNAGFIKKWPHVPGIDVAGIVSKSNSKKFKEGDEVIGTGFGIGAEKYGGYSQKLILPSDWILHRPKNLSLKDIAQEHLEEDSEMSGIRGLTKNYSLKNIQNLHLKVIFQELNEFDKELETHSDIENKILFPRALELQDKISDEIRNISFLN